MKSSGLLEYLDQLAECVKPVVDAIHEQMPTTKNYYGEYMSAMSLVALKGDQGKESVKLHPKVQLGIGVAFIRAGANKTGVMEALHVMGVL